MTKKETKKKDAVMAHPESEKAPVYKIEAEFGEIYFKVKGNDILRPIKARMCLFEKLGHIYKISGQKEFSISNTGYKYLNKTASINIVTPQKVSHGGKEIPNPYVERNAKTKAVETVAIRKIGIGYDPMGNIVVVDKSLFYNIYTYFIQSIQAKMNRKKWDHKASRYTDEPEFPGCAVIGTKHERPTEPEDAKWVFYETADPLGIWANYNHPAIIDCLQEHTQKQRFGDRIASTIVERNILKDHPAIGISKVIPQSDLGKTKNHKAYVTVYGYRHDFAPPDIRNLLMQAEKGSEELMVDAEVIEEIPEDVEKDAIKEEANGEKIQTPAIAEEPPDEFFLEQEEAKERIPGEEG